MEILTLEANRFKVDQIPNLRDFTTHNMTIKNNAFNFI